MQHHNRREGLRYRAGAVRGAVLSRCTISQVRPAQQTVILYSLQRCAFYPRPRRPHAAPPLSQSSRGSSLQRRGSTERQLHRLRTHGFHPVSQDALSHRYTPAERRTHQRMAEQVSARCTLCTPAPLDTPRQHARVLTRRRAQRNPYGRDLLEASTPSRPHPYHQPPDAHPRSPRPAESLQCRPRRGERKVVETSAPGRHLPLGDLPRAWHADAMLGTRHGACRTECV